jgi:hypothetical protein
MITFCLFPRTATHRTEIMPRHFPYILLFHHHLALLLLLSTKSTSHLIPRSSDPTPSPTPYPNDEAREEQGKTENPTLSLALKICFGLFGALFTAAVLFFAWRAARRQPGDVKPPADEDRSVGFLPPRYSRDGEPGEAMPRHPDDILDVPGTERGQRVVVRASRASGGEDVNGVRVPEGAHTVDRDERVVSWIREVEGPAPPPPYELNGGTTER